jgi:cytochrome c oxidase subunit 3
LEEIKIDFIGIPFLNTLILLYRGFILTLSHIKIILKKYFKNLIFFTLFLGLFFLIFQIFEYIFSNFSINDSVFGNTFFLYTSFHGFHVIIGFSLLLISFFFSNLIYFRDKKLVFFEISA